MNIPTMFHEVNGCRRHGNGQNTKKNEKHKNDHSRLLAKQKLMKLDRNNIHMNKLPHTTVNIPTMFHEV
jgi:hypothetical protein